MKEALENDPRLEVHELQPTLEDATEYFNMLNYKDNPEHFSNFGNMDTGKYPTAESVLEALKASESPFGKHRYAVRFKGRMIGIINLEPERATRVTPTRGVVPAAEVGYLVSKRFSGKGVGTAALKKLVQSEQHKYAFLFARTHAKNIGSQKVLRNVGFHHSGTNEDGTMVFKLDNGEDLAI